MDQHPCQVVDEAANADGISSRGFGGPRSSEGVSVGRVSPFADDCGFEGHPLFALQNSSGYILLSMNSTLSMS
jgi:hypothetical protein